jgi:energy-coupling factor transport system substrate-specific component
LERREENKMKNRKVYVTTFCGVAVAMNIVLGIITSALGIPLYLDTLGTVLSAAILGPVPGIIVGALSNIITGLIYSVSDIPFCLVNMAVGLIVGLVAKKWKFGIVPAIITGVALSFICPAIGTPIGIYVYGGLNGSVSDMLVMSLVQGGKTIFQASFLRNVASNLIDKIGTCVIGYLLIKAMPMRFLDNFKKEA